MKRFTWLGVLLAGAAIWTVSLFVSRYFAAPQAEVNMILSVLAVGGPAAILALIADRLRLSKSLLLCLAAYCLGSAVATGVLHGLQASGAIPPIRSLEAALVHAGSLTLFIPADRGYTLVWANLLWLAVAGLIASIILEAVTPKPGATPARKPAKRPQPKDGSSPKPRRALRPRRKPTRNNGTDPQG